MAKQEPYQGAHRAPTWRTAIVEGGEVVAFVATDGTVWRAQQDRASDSVGNAHQGAWNTARDTARGASDVDYQEGIFWHPSPVANALAIALNEVSAYLGKIRRRPGDFLKPDRRRLERLQSELESLHATAAYYHLGVGAPIAQDLRD